MDCCQRTKSSTWLPDQIKRDDAEFVLREVGTGAGGFGSMVKSSTAEHRDHVPTSRQLTCVELADNASNKPHWRRTKRQIM